MRETQMMGLVFQLVYEGFSTPTITTSSSSSSSSLTQLNLMLLSFFSQKLAHAHQLNGFS
jgi:hypothetical protein